MSDLEMEAAETDGLRTDVTAAAGTMAITATRRVAPDEDALEIDAGAGPEMEMLRTRHSSDYKPKPIRTPELPVLRCEESALG